jgi:uncharacterized protein (DUF2336 family)
MWRICDWNSVDYRLLNHTSISARPGVYIIARVRREAGIPLSIHVLYAGKSNSLQRRFREHIAMSETNPALLAMALTTGEGLEFWWAGIDNHMLDIAERHLIQALRPSANRIRYKTSKHAIAS